MGWNASSQHCFQEINWSTQVNPEPNKLFFLQTWYWRRLKTRPSVQCVTVCYLSVVVVFSSSCSFLREELGHRFSAGSESLLCWRTLDARWLNDWFKGEDKCCSHETCVFLTQAEKPSSTSRIHKAWRKDAEDKMRSKEEDAFGFWKPGSFSLTLLVLTDTCVKLRVSFLWDDETFNLQ